MIAEFIRWLKPKSLPAIEAGQRWQLKLYGDASPWPNKEEKGFIIVLDAKGGWVRYDMPGTPFHDNRLEEHSFRYCYARIE